MNLGINAKDITEVIQWAKKTRDDLEAEPTDYRKGFPLRAKRFLRDLIERCESAVTSVKQHSANKVPSKRKQSPVKLVSKLRFSMEDKETAITGVRPEGLIGAKRAIVWNAKERMVVYYQSENGFTVSGTSLKNFDIEKSFTIKVRKPADMKLAFHEQTVAKMRDWLKGLSTVPRPANGRFNESCVIVKIG